MSDFVAFFPAKECRQVPRSFSKLGDIFCGPLCAESVHSEVVFGAPIFLAKSYGRLPQFYSKADGSGWIVVKGIIFNCHSKIPTVDLGKLLDLFIGEKLDDLNDYEGTFALAAWDSRRAQGWVINDQASMLNLYYGEYDDGLYVTTKALALARALGLQLDPHSVQDFLALNVLIAPSAMFAGLQRVNIGEHLCYRAGTISYGKHWSAFEPVAEYRNLNEASATAAQMIVDRFSRYTAVNNSIICDLTAGLDSRLIVSTAPAHGLKPMVTVNGPVKSADVQVAHQVAKSMNWTIKHFDPQLFWTSEITPDMRRELIYHTNGELPFTQVYHQLLSRPLLAKNANIHVSGGGGELLRYFPWKQEWFGIGKKRLANINNLLKYRYHINPPPESLFLHNWCPSFRNRLKLRIEEICCEQPGTLTTQQLDAIYVWKMTSHISLFTSAVYNWLPSVAPMLSAGFVKIAVSMPWVMRLTSQLQRQIIYHLSPSVARVMTGYGSTAEPIRFKNLHLEIWQLLKQVGIAVDKLEHIALKGAISKRLSLSHSTKEETVPFLTREFRDFLEPGSMFSRGMYAADGLRMVLRGNDEDWQSRSSLIIKLASIEALCRELDFKPEGDFL